MAQGSPVTSIPSRSERRSKEPLDEFHQRELDQSTDRLNRRPGNEGARSSGYTNTYLSRPLSPKSEGELETEKVMGREDGEEKYFVGRRIRGPYA